MDDTSENIAATVRKMAEDYFDPQLINLEPIAGPPVTQTPQAMLLPQGMKLHAVEEFIAPLRAIPLRRKGTATLADLASFIAHASRFKDCNSALFANRAQTTLQSVLNYHMVAEPGGGGQRFGDHRGKYQMVLSPEWRAWQAVADKKLDQGEFAELLEDRVGDLIAPPIVTEGTDPAEGDRKLLDFLALLQATAASPSRMMALSRGIKVHEKATLVEARNLASGEGEFSYKSEHNDESGAPLRVPNCFLIAIPVFEAGALYRLVVRLRYRFAAGRLSWMVQIQRPDESLRHAFEEAAGEASSQTTLPLFYGEPE